MKFGTSGYTMDRVFVLYDRASESVWYPIGENLEAVGGGRKGEQVPFLDEPAPQSLALWLDQYPDSTVLLPSERDFRILHRPRLGLRIKKNDEGDMVVTTIGEGSPAEATGVAVGDLLRSFAGHPIKRRRDLRELLIDRNAGDVVDLLIERDGEEMILRPTLVAADEDHG